MSDHRSTARIWECPRQFNETLAVDVSEMKHELPASRKQRGTRARIAVELLARIIELTARRSARSSWRACVCLDTLARGGTIGDVATRLKISHEGARKIARFLERKLTLRLTD